MDLFWTAIGAIGGGISILIFIGLAYFLVMDLKDIVVNWIMQIGKK